jgi:hypothetical protein
VHLEVAIGVVARGGDQYVVVGDDQRPLGFAGGPTVLYVDPIGLLGQIRRDRVERGGGGWGGYAQGCQLGDVRCNFGLVASGVAGVEQRGDINRLD